MIGAGQQTQNSAFSGLVSGATAALGSGFGKK